jgi:hypothetical protein
VNSFLLYSQQTEGSAEKLEKENPAKSSNLAGLKADKILIYNGIDVIPG